jgi:hypothetical protein
MTVAERMELGKLVRLNAKVAKDDAEARGKWLMADVEAKLAVIYKFEDECWAELTDLARCQVNEANAKLTTICRERGIPDDLRPRLELGWRGRGESDYKERRAELRKVASSQTAARVAQAKVEIDRQAALQLTRIAQTGLTSEEARAFLEAMPEPAKLLPAFESLEMTNGKVVALKAPVPAGTAENPPARPAGSEGR